MKILIYSVYRYYLTQEYVAITSDGNLISYNALTHHTVPLHTYHLKKMKNKIHQGCIYTSVQILFPSNHTPLLFLTKFQLTNINYATVHIFSFKNTITDSWRLR